VVKGRLGLDDRGWLIGRTFWGGRIRLGDGDGADLVELPARCGGQRRAVLDGADESERQQRDANIRVLEKSHDDLSRPKAKGFLKRERRFRRIPPGNPDKSPGFLHPKNQGSPP
jgi:hypothetical protein